MTDFDICHVLVRTMLYSKLYFKQPESAIYQYMFEQFKIKVLVNSNQICNLHYGLDVTLYIIHTLYS